MHDVDHLSAGTNRGVCSGFQTATNPTKSNPHFGDWRTNGGLSGCLYPEYAARQPEMRDLRKFSFTQVVQYRQGVKPGRSNANLIKLGMNVFCAQCLSLAPRDN